MFAVLAAILCCAVIPVVLGIAAYSGLFTKKKEAANQEEAITQQERYQ